MGGVLWVVVMLVPVSCGFTLTTLPDSRSALPPCSSLVCCSLVSLSSFTSGASLPVTDKWWTYRTFECWVCVSKAQAVLLFGLGQMSAALFIGNLRDLLQRSCV